MYCGCSVSLAVSLLSLISVSSAAEYTLNWTTAGVAALHWNISVDIGDKLILLCVPGSYSNVVEVGDKSQQLACNSTTATELRGSCIGRVNGTRLIFNIEQASAKLPGDFGFVEGEDSFLTSFSNGLDATSSFSDIKSGGECTEGLKLTVHVRDSSPTVSKPATTTETNSVDQTTDSLPPSSSTTETKPVDFTEFELSPEGLISGSSPLHRTSTILLLTCTVLLAFMLRSHS